MSTTDVADFDGVRRAIQNPLAPGQGLMAASRPVVIASDQSAVPVSGTITANIGTGTLSTVTTVSTVTNLSQFGGAAINLGAGAVGTGTLRITQASDSPLVTATGAIADAAWTTGSGSVISLLKAVAGAAIDTTTPSPVKIDQTTVGTTNAVSLAQLGSTTVATGNGVVSAGVQRVAIASDNTAFSVNATTTPATTAFALIPAPSTYRVATSAASTNAANVKSSAGCIKGIQGVNHVAATVYIHFYDMTTSPTVGTSTIRKTQEVPASAAFAFDYGTGIGFATGISISMTKGSSADTDTTVLASGDITSLNVDYH